MDRQQVLNLLHSLSAGDNTVAAAYEQLKGLPFKNIGFAQIDNHRSLRQGFPEVIYCPGKSVEQIVAIASHLKAEHSIVVATRAEAELAKKIQTLLPDTAYHSQARMITWGHFPPINKQLGQVTTLTAGTADLPVAEEAILYLKACGIAVESIFDVGVAGLQRLLSIVPNLQASEVIIVIAGMDGALPSVVAGLVEAPVIAVPTSVGYGASFDGLAALLTMLNSCAAGLTVVNIDNGFGAAAAAIRILCNKKVKQ